MMVLATSGGDLMSDDSGWALAGALIGVAILYGSASHDTKTSPCVYSHGWLTDLVNGNDQKRTCAALLKESNSRIEAQQARIGELTEQLDALHAAPESRFPAGAPSQSSSDSASTEAPTLSAQVDSDLAHAKDQDDQDD
jgi:hypothetical protein